MFFSDHDFLFHRDMTEKKHSNKQPTVFHTQKEPTKQTLMHQETETCRVFFSHPQKREEWQYLQDDEMTQMVFFYR